MGKASSKSSTRQQPNPAPTKPLVAIGEPKASNQTKKPYFKPWNSTQLKPCYLFGLFFSADDIYIYICAVELQNIGQPIFFSFWFEVEWNTVDQLESLTNFVKGHKVSFSSNDWILLYSLKPWNYK